MSSDTSLFQYHLVDIEKIDCRRHAVCGELTGASASLAGDDDALTVLGFHRSAAEEVLKTIDVANTDLEDIIREALKKLMK